MLCKTSRTLIGSRLIVMDSRLIDSNMSVKKLKGRTLSPLDPIHEILYRYHCPLCYVAYSEHKILDSKVGGLTVAIQRMIYNSKIDTELHQKKSRIMS